MTSQMHAAAGTTTAALRTMPATSTRTRSPCPSTEVAAEHTAEGSKRGPGSRSRICRACGFTKGLGRFPRRGPGRQRGYSCNTCEALRVRKYQRAALYPTATADGLADTPGAVRAAALAKGFASGFEREVAARLASEGCFTHREGAVFLFAGDKGETRVWTPDFASPSGPVIEAKGMVWKDARTTIEAVRAAHPTLDIRFVLQTPHRVGDVWASPLTPAQWAESLGCRWTTLDQLAALTDGMATERPTDELAVLIGNVPDKGAD
jgi:hypothetical protein